MTSLFFFDSFPAFPSSFPSFFPAVQLEKANLYFKNVVPGLSFIFKRSKLISRYFTKLFKSRFKFFCTGNYLKNLKPFFKQKIKKKFKKYENFISCNYRKFYAVKINNFWVPDITGLIFNVIFGSSVKKTRKIFSHNS